MLASPLSSNTGSHLSTYFHGKPRTYKPLLYCSDGGNRSKYMAIILKLAKFNPYVLTGGYRAYRQFVKEHLLEEDDQKRVEQCRYIAVTGPPCAGKRQFLFKLAEKEEQILNLEEMAVVNEPFIEDKSCPSQHYFESKIFHQLALELTTERVVWVVYEKSGVPNLGKSSNYCLLFYNFLGYNSIFNNI